MMAKGQAFLLKIKNEPHYETVAGLRVTSMSTGQDHGPRRMSVEASGIFLGSDAEAALRAHALSGTLDDYELSFDDGTRARGRFLIQRLDYAGDYNGERTYLLRIESVGEVVPA